MKKHDILLRLLSLVLAFVLWAFVMNEDNPERKPWFDEIPVTVSGESKLLEEHGLSIIEMSADTVSVRLRGPNNEVTDKSLKQRITAAIDVSKLDKAGEYDLPVVPAVNRSGIDTLGTNPATIRVRVDKVTTRTVPVRVEVVGTPADACRAGTPVPITTEVTIEGPEADLMEVAYAYTTINADGKEATFTADCQLTLYNDAGAPITGTQVSSQTQTVKVRLPIYPIETIPLTVTLKDGGTVKADKATVRIEPESIKVIGDQKTIAEMKELNLGEIDLGSVKTDAPIEMEIQLPDKVRLDEGQPSTAKVTVSVDGVSTRKVQVTRFVPTDTAADQTAFAVSVSTQHVEIELRGSENALAEVDANSFSIGLTFDSASLGAGIHSVKGMVVATGLPAGVTLVEEDVQVMIEITAAQAGESDAAGGQTDDAPPDASAPEEGGDGT